MRLAFLGSPAFAEPALLALHGAGHAIVTVYCQPPRPAGRGHRLRPCPVHAAADRLGIPVRTPARLRNNQAEQQAFEALNLDAAVVAAYGLILPQHMLAAPRHGCINVHASLLPRWRGAAPIQAAILAGDSETGITIMQMDAGLDTGPMLLSQAIPIPPRATASELHDQLAALGAELIVRALDEQPPAQPQPEAGATYAPKLTRDDGRIVWDRDYLALDRQVRALNPWPGTFCMLGTETLKVLAAEPAPGNGTPGQVLDPHLTVACGTGALRLTRIQLPGRAPLETADFLRGHAIPIGTKLG
jgi:methionyl-tRNA formyltransferase